jgi:hypothetical protein
VVVELQRDADHLVALLGSSAATTEESTPPDMATTVDHGLLAPEEACEMYQLSSEELEIWRSAVRQHGAAALRVTAIQKYRQP